MEINNIPENLVLENNFVALRPLELSDIEYLIEYSINEPEIWFYSLAQGSGKEKLPVCSQAGGCLFLSAEHFSRQSGESLALLQLKIASTSRLKSNTCVMWRSC